MCGDGGGWWLSLTGARHLATALLMRAPRPGSIRSWAGRP